MTGKINFQSIGKESTFEAQHALRYLLFVLKCKG